MCMYYYVLQFYQETHEVKSGTKKNKRNRHIYRPTHMTHIDTHNTTYTCIFCWPFVNNYSGQWSNNKINRNSNTVSRDIVSSSKTILGMDKSVTPDGINRYRVSPYACNFLSSGCDFTRWGIDGDRNRVSPDTLVWGVLYFVTTA